MKKKSGIVLEKNIEIIAIDYLNITGSKDLKELEEKHSYFYEKYLEEKNRNIKIKKIIEFPKFNFANLIDNVCLCNECKAELIFIFHKKKLFYTETSYQHENGIVKIFCSCGKENIFDFNKK